MDTVPNNTPNGGRQGGRDKIIARIKQHPTVVRVYVKEVERVRKNQLLAKIGEESDRVLAFG